MAGAGAGAAPRPAIGSEAFKRAAAACKDALAEALWPAAKLGDGAWHKSRHRAVARDFVARHVLREFGAGAGAGAGAGGSASGAGAGAGAGAGLVAGASAVAASR